MTRIFLISSLDIRLNSPYIEAMLTTCVQHQRVPPSHQIFEEQTDISEIKARIVSSEHHGN